VEQPGLGTTPLPGADAVELIATTAFGLEAVVARELQALGYEGRIIENGRVLFTAPPEAICRANLWLRAAERVLVRMGHFPASDFGQLFDGVRALPWEAWIPRDGAFPVRGRSVRSQLSSVPACQRIAKKAIVERLRQAHGVQELPESGPECIAEVALLADEATLTLDTSGPGLHKRGYRTGIGPAPLKETLAAGLVLLSFWRPERPLLDPFCGSGTIPIEAALIGRNLAPGLHRTFLAESWPALAREHWTRARAEARDLAREMGATILGTDIDPRAIGLARQHARAAGVDAQIHLQVQPFGELASRKEHGCLIANPPYGERMSERAEVAALYRSMPDVLRHLKTWSIYILTAWPDFEKLLGQTADRRRKLYNGRIACTYYQFHGPDPRKPAAAPAPVFGGVSVKGREQAEMFKARLQKREHHLRRWAQREGISCFRLYDRDIPEIPLAVDRYGDCLHIREYERPHERTPAEHADWIDLMARAAGDALEVRRGLVFVKHRARQRGLKPDEPLSNEQRVFEVLEGGLRFQVNLSDYVGTGLFLDHRQTRARVRAEAAGQRFLNLFGHTGTFTVYAAAGEARRTTTVDPSNSHLAWAERNMRANGFVGGAHRCLRADALTFLREHRPGPSYDLVVVDPPTFSSHRMTIEDWEVQREHASLLTQVLALMTSGGVIYFATHLRSFKLDQAGIPGATISEISHETVPPDFRNRRVHRCWRMVKNAQTP